MTGPSVPRLGLDPNADELWAFIDSFDLARFSGQALDRQQWLRDFDSIYEFMEAKESSSRFAKMIARTCILTFTPLGISIVFFETGYAQVIGFALSCLDAWFAAHGIAREARERGQRRRIREAIRARLQLLGA